MSDQGVILPPETVAPQPPVHNAFRGPNGIRAGWRVLIFFLVLAALVFLVSLPFAIRARLNGEQSGGIGFGVSGLTPLGLSISEGTLLLFTALAALIMSRIERRKFGQYGLPVKYAFRKDFWVGLVAGFLAISAALLGIFALHGFHLTGITTHGATLLAATAAWSATFVIVGLAEEFSSADIFSTRSLPGWVSGRPRFCSRYSSGWRTRETQARQTWGFSRWCFSDCFSVFSCAVPAISGGP
jgi:hypothetical protein